MLRIRNKFICSQKLLPMFMQKQTFLTKDYKCIDAWNSQTMSPQLHKLNLNDFYNTLEQNHSAKGVISAIDVDLFANSVNDSIYLEELKDLLHKLRLTAETGNTLESTHHATIRHFIEFNEIDDLINILNDPLNFGIFLDNYTANILLDKLITAQNYKQAANVAALIMLQEEYTNDITSALCQYACYKYIMEYVPPAVTEPEEKKNEKIEEKKIRIKFLRNPYFDDHFDIKDIYLLSGKTLAWISEKQSDNININLQLIGWLVYKKFENLLSLCESLDTSSYKIYSDVLYLCEREYTNIDDQRKEPLQKCISILKKAICSEEQLEDSIKNVVENAINRTQKKDITQQQQLFKEWVKVREEKLNEQIQRLDRAKRIQVIQLRQKELQNEEQMLWFFENEEKLDLEIENKEKFKSTTVQSQKTSSKSDENYIPPEILPKKR